MRLVIAVNVDWFFLSHRLEVAKAAAEAGWEVHVVTALTDASKGLDGFGFVVHDLPMHRSSWNPLGLLRTLARFVTLFRKLRPDVIHLVTIKPVLLGGIAARLVRVPGVVFAVSGLGHVFIANSLLGRVRRSVVRALYKLSMGRSNKVVIFQNDVDEIELKRLGCIRDSEAFKIPGSGFDVDGYRVTEPPVGIPVFLMASRLIRSKGVLEFVDAANRLHREGVKAEFWLAGAPDPLNPEGLSDEDVASLQSSSYVRVLGHRDDIPELMRLATVVVLPSYYGEGLPKVLIEAAAAGRAIITTDAPGCRDAIEDGVTGLLVTERDAGALADAMRTLLTDSERARDYGRAGRRRAEEIFRIEDVVAQHLRIYDSLVRGRQ